MVAFTAFTLLLCLVHGTTEAASDKHSTVFKYTVNRIRLGDESDIEKCNETYHTFYKDGNSERCIANTTNLGNHSDLNFTVNGSTIHFVEKENIMRYNIDNINNICKTSHSKPQIVKLWYQDGSWKDDLDSFKVYSQIIYIEKKQIAINFTRHFTGLLIRLDISCDAATTAYSYLFEFEGTAQHPVDISMYNTTVTNKKDKDEDDVTIGIVISVICLTLVLGCMVALIYLMKRWKEKVRDPKRLARQGSTASTLGALNNAYEPGQDPIDETLKQNTEHNITIVVEDTSSVKGGKNKKVQNDDHTLNFFLHNVESTISTKDLKLLDVNPLKKLRDSFRAKDSTKDHILVGFLRSFEFSELGHETKKQVPVKSTEKRLRSRGERSRSKGKSKLKPSEERAKSRQERAKPESLEGNASFKTPEEKADVTSPEQNPDVTTHEEKPHSKSFEDKAAFKNPEEWVNVDPPREKVNTQFSEEKANSKTPPEMSNVKSPEEQANLKPPTDNFNLKVPSFEENNC